MVMAQNEEGKSEEIIRTLFICIKNPMQLIADSYHSIWGLRQNPPLP